jgi:hypothetical protein
MDKSAYFSYTEAKCTYHCEEGHMSQSQVIYWGEGGQFGPFDTQEDGWPNAGQVMRYFREKQGLTAKAFGKLYGKEIRENGKPIGERWVLMMELENQVPTDITRRRFIAKLLGIPPVLFGLASLDSSIMQPQKTLNATPAVVQSSAAHKVSTNIGTYQKNIHLALQHHQMSHAQTLLPEIAIDLRDLESLERQAGGDLLTHVRELLVANNFLASRIERDSGQYARAYISANNAVRTAQSLGDDELLAAAKYTRGSTKFAWGRQGFMKQGRFQLDTDKMEDAMRDFQDILNMETSQPASIHPQLLGFTMLQLSRAQGSLSQGTHDQTVITNVLTLTDQVADLVGRDTIDDLYTRAMVTGVVSGLHLGGYHLGRANVFNAVGLPGKAIAELNQLQFLTAQTYGRDETRNQAWMDIVMSEALLGLQDYAEATNKAKGALITCHNIHSMQNVTTIIDIHSQLATSSYGISTDVKELGNMLLEWYGERIRLL